LTHVDACGSLQRPTTVSKTIDDWSAQHVRSADSHALDRHLHAASTRHFNVSAAFYNTKQLTNLQNNNNIVSVF